MAKKETDQEWIEAAEGWRKWGDYIEEAGAGVTQLLIDAAKIGPGSRVVDIGTGHGDPALTIAALVGPGGHVTATDISPAMIGVARERAEARGLTNIDFVAGDAGTLALPEGSYDAIVSRHTLMFLEQPAAALKRLRKALVPGGRIAAACWGAAEEVPFLTLAFGPVMQALEAPPPPPGQPGPFALGSPGTIEGVFVDAGLTDVTSGTSSTTFVYAKPEQFTEIMQDCAPQIPQMLAEKPPEVLAKVWEQMTEAVRGFAAADGTVSLENQVVWAAGTR